MQQTLLQNLRNPATALGQTPSASQSARLVNQLNRMTQTMMSNLNGGGGARTGTPSGGARTGAPSVATNNLIPVDVLLRQQRNLQAQMLQNLQNTQNVNIPNTLNTGITQNQNVNSQGPQQTTNSNDVTVVVIPQNNTSVPNAGTTSVVSQTSEVNPFSASTGNVTFDDILTNFGGFSIPSSSADFWTGRTDAIRSTGSDGQSTGSRSSMFPFTGGFTNLENRQRTGSQTTFDPATGITFGSGFTSDQQTTSGTSSQGTGSTPNTRGGITFGSGTLSGIGSTSGSNQQSTGSTFGSGASTFGLNLPGGFRTGIDTQTTGTSDASSASTTLTTGGITVTDQPAIVPDAVSTIIYLTLPNTFHNKTEILYL